MLPTRMYRLSRSRIVIENGEHKDNVGDRQFLKHGECVKI